MKSDVMAPVLAAMNPDAAQKLTLKLADKLARTPLRRWRRPRLRLPRPPGGASRRGSGTAAWQPPQRYNDFNIL